jgi:hypothetical protein
MTADVSTIVDADGAVEHTITYPNAPHDPTHECVVVRVEPQTKTYSCTAYENGDVGFQQQFQQRSLSFDPVSLNGGSSSTVTGVSTTKTNPYTDEHAIVDCTTLPQCICHALTTLGVAVVPRGEWWL